ncbi:MAG TPA: GGDEF domain-containing protein, partial [Mariprofundaceae bacterium]|nr:GGDEF domain-containing protein [Mariprofundaceae bacterium]
MIQQLDMMTLTVMCLLINTVLAAMLLMVGRHIQQARGIRDWSLGIVLISLALVIATHLIRHKGDIWLLMPANMLFGYGNGLFLVAIRKFREKETHALLPLAIGTIAVLINALFLFVIPDLPLRLLFISFFYAGVNAFCARELLRSTSGRLHSAYLWTGGVFALFSLVMGVRALAAWLAPERVLLKPPHPAMTATGVFAFVGLMLLCSTVGYVLLLTYRMAAEMERLASHDSLTGALNRRSLDVVAQPALARASRNNSGLTALLIDIDHFKKVNDRYGHQVGDEVLRRFADIVRNQIRAGDHFARYGGEEFCILMPDAH